MKVAVAQISSVKGDIKVNISTHLRVIETASKLGIDFVVFPELSLTGYEPELASELAFSEDYKRLLPLIKSAASSKIHIGIGAPILSCGLPYLGLFIIHPTSVIESYKKIHLHPGEENFFRNGEQHHLLEIEGVKIANAICADTNQVGHAKTCVDLGANVYMAGVLISKNGYDADTATLKTCSQEHGILVAMANYNKTTGDLAAVGKSAIWFKGELLASANTTQSALVIAEKQDNNWVGQVVAI